MKKMLFFIEGSLGDSLIIFPILKEFRRKYPDAQFHFLVYNQYGGRQLLNSIFENTNLCNKLHVICGPVMRLAFFAELIKMYFNLLFTPYSSAVVLSRSPFRPSLFNYLYTPLIVVFLKCCLIPRIYGIKGIFRYIKCCKNKPYSPMPRHIELYKMRFALENINFDEDDFSVELTKEEKERGYQYLVTNGICDKFLFGVGIGGKKDLCKYPIANYKEILKTLIDECNIFPVFFGGKENIDEINDLICELKCGINVAEKNILTLRETIAVMGQCKYYLGNDTGTSHMAASAGCFTFVIQANNSPPGIWNPVSRKSYVFRNKSECDVACSIKCPIASPSPCLQKISSTEVSDTIKNIIRNQ